MPQEKSSGPWTIFCEMSATGGIADIYAAGKCSPSCSVAFHHHFISPLFTLAPISSATIRPAVG